MRVNPAYYHHGQGPKNIALGQAMRGAVLKQQHVGSHVHQDGADAQQKIVQHKQRYGAGFAVFYAKQALQVGGRGHAVSGPAPPGSRDIQIYAARKAQLVIDSRERWRVL